MKEPTTGWLAGFTRTGSNPDFDYRVPELVPIETEILRERHEVLREAVDNACERAGRDPDDVKVVAVTKGFPVDAIREAVRLGYDRIGENRVRRAVEKKEETGELSGEVEWHMIGHVQSNKVRYLVGEFDLIHSVDRPSLIDELEKRSSRQDVTQDVLLQVNVSGEESKHGADPEEAKDVLERVLSTESLRVRGLMTMAPHTDDTTVLRGTFERCRTLRDDLEGRFGVDLPELSMGMTNDYPQAILEGSTMLRIGRGLFGERPE